MKPFLLYFAIIFISCNSATTEPKIASATEDQRKIDSLTSIINEKEKQETNKKTKQEKSKKLQQQIDERNSLLTKINFSEPDFDHIDFGGLKNISFFLFNDSKYKLDQVILKVHYIRANHNEIKSETQILHNVEANSRLPLTSPDYTAAGRYVTVSLESVQCKAINFCMYNTMDTTTHNDFYNCDR